MKNIKVYNLQLKIAQGENERVLSVFPQMAMTAFFDCKCQNICTSRCTNQALSIVWKSIKVSLTTPVVFLHNPNPDAGGTTRFCAIKYANCGVFIYLSKSKFYRIIQKFNLYGNVAVALKSIESQK